MNWKEILKKYTKNNHILSEEEKIEQLKHITDSYEIYMIAMKLSEKNRVDERILQKLNNRDIVNLLNSINDIELVKQGLIFLDGDALNTAKVINQEKYDSRTKLNLLKYINTSDNYTKNFNRLSIIETITEDELLEEALEYFENEIFKVKIINKISNDDIKLRLAKNLNEENNRYEVSKAIDPQTLIKNLEILNLSDNHIKDILTTNENGIYIYTEEERIEQLNHIKSSAKIYMVVMTLSDKNKVDERVLQKLYNSDIVDLLKIINDIELVKKGLIFLDGDAFNATKVINQEKYDSITKLNLLKYITHNENFKTEFNRMNVVDTITEDEQLEEALQYFEIEKNKVKIINRISNNDIKLRLAKNLTEENNRYEVSKTINTQTLIKKIEILNLSDEHKKDILTTNENGVYTYTEEERLEQLNYITDSNKIYTVAMTLEENNKVDERVLKKLNNSDIVNLLNSINDIELVKKGLIFLDGDALNAAKVINQEKYDSRTKLNLLKYINNNDNFTKEFNRMSIIETIIEDELLEEALQYFEIEKNKVKIINKISSDEIKLKLAQNLVEENNRYELSKIINPQILIKNLEILNLSDNHIKDILTTNENGIYTYTEEERLERLNLLKELDKIYIIAMTLSSKNKVDKRVLEILGSYEIVNLLKSINDIELVKKGLIYLDKDSYNAIKVVIQEKYDSKTKLYLLKYIKDKNTNITEFSMMDVIETIKEDELLEEALEYFVIENYKIKIINKINNYDIKLRLAKKMIENIKDIHSIKNTIQTFSYKIRKSLLLELDKIIETEKQISNITNQEDFNQKFLKLCFGSKYRILTNSNRNITDELRILYLNYFVDEQDKLDIISKIILDENKISAYNKNPFKEEKNKMEYLKLLQDENKKNLLDILNNEFYKLVIINEIKNIPLKELALEKMTNYQKTFKELFNLGDYKLISNFDDKILLPIFNSKQIIILHEYNSFSNDEAKIHFSKYIHENYDKLAENDIKIISQLIFNVITSNSEEIYKQSNSFIANILSSNDPLNAFAKVENIFLKNHLPSFAKAYLTFLTVHPNFESYRFNNINEIGHYVSSLVLKNVSVLHRKVLVLTDLIKCSLRSNSINFLKYLEKLESQNNLYIKYKTSDYNLLSPNIRSELTEFRDSIMTLYQQYLRKKKIESTENVLEDLNKINNYVCKKQYDKALVDMIIDGFCHFIGIYSINDAKKYAYNELVKANKKNIKRYIDNDYRIEQGDFIKGFNINYFFEMANNGIVAHDYLGADMETDMTALDTDLSRIWKETTGLSIKEIINLKDKDSGYFGQGYIVIKDDPDKIDITKKSNNEEYSRINTVNKNNIFKNKIEAFSNGTSDNISNPYGIRTGFSLSDIDFIVFDEEGGFHKENIYKIILPLVMNGIYIPIISKSEKVLFTLDDFNKLREKMNGLSQYGISDYKLSPNIENEKIKKIISEIDDSNICINKIKSIILNIFNDGLDNEFKIITYINGKLERNEIQVLDTGSTSRATNIPYDGDFDFIIRIDRNIDNNIELKNNFIKKIISKFNIIEPGKNINGDIKDMIVKIEDKKYKLDLSFVRKTDKVSYSTEMCVSDRLDTIKKLYPDKYKSVLANIIYAKQYLKENNCYSKGKYKQGGLGGIGVENWILQNGGSFYDAAVEFISYATEDGNFITYNDFVNRYKIWDFGENFYTDRENRQNNKTDNLHDNFILKNLTEEGYKNMCNALKKFILEYKINQSQLFCETTSNEERNIKI